MQVLRRRSAPAGVVYGSTTGVYGNCGGAWIDETRTVHAETPRAQRRVHAEESMRFWGRSAGVSVSVLRIPGIYAQDREGGTPRGRLMRGTPVLHAQDDVYTNHINADDLARACVAALWRGKPQRVVNVNDDAAFKMGDYLDAAADLYGLPHPTRVSWDQAAKQLSPMQLSFMGESRRLCNRRMKTELRVVLRFPSVLDGLA
jgi:nucleoside-diphosphate-sugar epimerase